MAGDTTPDAAAVRLAIYRRLSPAERYAIGSGMSMAARAIALAGIRRRHPEYDDAQARLALFRFLLGHDTFHRVWPGAPALDP